MTLFYDRDYRPERWTRYDRGFRMRSGQRGQGLQDMGGRPPPRGYRPGYDVYRGYRDEQGPVQHSRPMRDRYDASQRGRWQTDFGDPFNDRGAGTPIRMMRGPYREGGGEEMRGPWGYDDDFSGRRGYDPYEGRDRLRETGTWMGYGRRGGRWGYDSDWW